MGTQVLQTGVERWATELSYRAGDGTDVPVYAAYPKQALFHNNPAKYRLFGGAAGPGKSLALLMEAVLKAHQAGEFCPEVHTLLLRRTVPELEGSLLQLFRRQVPQEMYLDWHEQKKTVTWLNYAKTRFGSMQYVEDVWGYQGHEYAFIGWDELTRFLLKQWETMKIWNRCSVELPYRPGMAGATNPIGIGAAWVRAFFVNKKAAPGMADPSKYDPSEYAFIPALVTDNPIYANSADYLRTLDSLPPVLRAAMLAGRWDVAIGAYFDIFDHATHVIPLAKVGAKDWWPKWISCDWGFEHPCDVQWHTTSPEGRHYTYRELNINHIGPTPLGEMIAEVSLDAQGRPEVIDDFFLSPDAFARRTDAESIAAQLGQSLRRKGLPEPQMASTDRVGGWMLLYSLLQRGQWFITENCTKLIEMLPLLPRDEDKVEDVAKMDGDDPPDSARYGLYSRLGANLAPLAERVAAKVTAEDPTIRHIQAMRAFEQEKKRGQPIQWGSRYVPASPIAGKRRPWAP